MAQVAAASSIHSLGILVCATRHSTGIDDPFLRQRPGKSFEDQSAKGMITYGAREDRTPDLLTASQALSQLSYGPIMKNDTEWEQKSILKLESASSRLT